jgi:hypothetical protein
MKLGTCARLLFCQLFYFFTVLDLVDEDLGRLKAWDIMLIDNQSSIPGNIPGDFLLPLFVNKTSKTADINIVTVGHRGLYHAKKGFYGRCNICFINSCFFSYFVYYICFSHGAIFRCKIFSGGQI